MNRESLQFFTNLLETPSPSGFEQRIQRVVKKRMQAFSDDVTVDVHGNLIASWNANAPIRVMLAGHCDQIGMMVHHIDDRGFLNCQSIGGIDPAVLPGSKVTVLTSEGDIEGIIGFKPVHLVPPHERGQAVDLGRLWIDIGAKDGAEAKRRVSIGDPVVYKLGVTQLNKNIIVSPGCDDKAGLFVCMEALRLVAQMAKGKAKKSCPVGLFAVSTVQEEIGLRGARTSCHGIDPLVGIAVDVTHASDNPGADPKSVGTVKLGGGPTISRGPNINPIVEELLISTAKRKRIPYQLQSSPGATGTDANSIQITRAGVAAGLVGIPNRYMHTTVEMVDLRDLEQASKLLAESILKITRRMTFIPA